MKGLKEDIDFTTLVATNFLLQVGVPKKPYNPVLGEVFCCYWDVPGGRRTAPNETEKVSKCSN